MNYFERKLPGIDQIHSRGPRTMEEYAQDELGRYEFDSILDAYRKLPPEDFIIATKTERWVRHFSGGDPKPTMQEIVSQLTISVTQNISFKTTKAYLVPVKDSYVIELSASLPENEKQFTIAHELGHVFMRDWLKLEPKDTNLRFDKQEALCELIALYFLREHLLKDGELPPLTDIPRTFAGDGYSLDWAVDIYMLHGFLPRTITQEDGSSHCFNCRYLSPCTGSHADAEHYQKIPDDILQNGVWTPCRAVSSSLDKQAPGSGRSF